MSYATHALPQTQAYRGIHASLMPVLMRTRSSESSKVSPMLLLQWGMHQSAVVGGLLLSGVILSAARYALRERRRTTLFLRRRPFRRCPRCSGFGVIRCTMCSGEGIVRYEKKMSHVDVCPQCLLRRYCSCSMCDGSGKRPRVSERTNLLQNFLANLSQIQKRLR